jgi:long-chain acyl-CoA synthetase
VSERSLASLLLTEEGTAAAEELVFFDGEWTGRAELVAAARALTSELEALGVEPGRAVVSLVPSSPPSIAAMFGVWAAGCPLVPLSPRLTGAELTRAVGEVRPAAVVAPGGLLDRHAGALTGCTLVEQHGPAFRARGPAATGAGVEVGTEVALVLYTSGTTGTPKGAELTHDNLRRNAEIAVGLFSLGEDAVVLGALPLFHSFGQTCGMNACVRAGGMLTLVPRFDAGKALEVITRDRVSVFEGVPTMYMAMLHHADAASADTSSLRVCASGGAAMPVEVMRAFEEQFGCIVLEGYGLSETSPVASFNSPDRERQPGSIGTPIEGVEMKVVDDDDHDLATGEVGEIVIRGHNIMKGYWQRPEATEECMRGGWFHSGDMARVDEDGYFFIVDRKKDLIIRGGYNVYPREVEEVLYEHPAVAEAAVLGVPHDELGEEVAAAVALKEGRQVDVDELQAYVKEQVAAYKYPRTIWVVDELPKGPTGKILKREIQPPA